MMATNVIMPALGMAQESGVLVNWLKKEGDSVTKGEPIMEIETDKVTVEIEAAASGILRGVLARAGDVVPVGQTIAWILAPGEALPANVPAGFISGRKNETPIPPKVNKPEPEVTPAIKPAKLPVPNASFEISPLARRIAEEHGVDLSLVGLSGRRIEKADVIAYIQAHPKSKQTVGENASVRNTSTDSPARILASPKARRLAAERGLDLATISGSGPLGAVITADVLEAPETTGPAGVEMPSTVWRLMAEHMTNSWTTVPHFYLMREVDAGNLIEWREHITPLLEKKIGVKPTYTDLLVKLIAVTLPEHPRLNAAWAEAGTVWNQEINIGIATAVEQGLIVPVIHAANTASVGEIAAQRRDLVERAQQRKLRPADIAGATFTLSNLGMYNVDAFLAIVNTPQAAILAVGRIADRIVPVNGQAVVKPMLTLSLSCDHRVVDGARAAQFLDDLANLIEYPWRLLS
jgi:pyruvate dehydrogenase E2 component (dihydrolipoamide acetyltransferase)